ncbi:MAG TPA: F0F1 ATP synthase subunit delta [Clostridia bacterium]|jgi:F0F1-type ATP synthase delta subunit|nr:MAG: F0F1 ATP synthase subunit delta [Firmicutes bacterium ADurb.Bin248]HOG00885.1 F0F1 ATP synthase subunit delta [Clostridia bacterium]HOS19551.1 F0F1 ATP synthase subunit delta [Clostridia bacterium]HPK15884.1 F0F1 ATP synthase subunit delta [Clostridia bacterium]
MELKGELYIAGPFGEAQISSVGAHFARLLGREVVFEVRRDESLIGGFLAMVDGKVYDASVASRMRDARRHLIAKN